MKEFKEIDPNVTMTLDEYNRLLTLANTNREKIEELALEHYKKKGVCIIRVEACIKEERGIFRDIMEKFEFECSPSGTFVEPSDYFPKNGQFYINSATRERIKEFVADYVSAIFRRRFGLHLTSLNAVLRYKRRTKLFMSISYVLTITGWIIAFFMFMANYGN